MATLQLGNDAVIETRKIDDDFAVEEGNVQKYRRKDLGDQITTVSLPDTYIALEKDGSSTAQWSLDQQIATVKQFVSLHFATKPVWVESDDKILAQVVSSMYDCPLGRPKNWKNGHGAE